MARTKLKKLKKLYEMPNVFSSRDTDAVTRLKNFFATEKLLTLEIGCGHGDYTVELAKIYPERNFIGIDIKGARIYRGASRAIEMKLENVAFLIAKAESLATIFDAKTIEEIYIPFPDPHVKRSKQSRRLVSPPLLEIYKALVIDSSRTHFKTDNSKLFDYALTSIERTGGKILFATENLNKEQGEEFNPGILTSYEKYYLREGRTIKYVCFKF